jgi:hypothetical protein
MLALFVKGVTYVRFVVWFGTPLKTNYAALNTRKLTRSWLMQLGKLMVDGFSPTDLERHFPRSHEIDVYDFTGVEEQLNILTLVG